MAGVSKPNYVDYALGVVYDFGGGLSLYGDINKARAIVSINKTL